MNGKTAKVLRRVAHSGTLGQFLPKSIPPSGLYKYLKRLWNDQDHKNKGIMKMRMKDILRRSNG